MEHTNEFLRGMFAAYMGCGCEITETQEGITTITKAESSGVVSERVHFAGAGLFVHFSKLKPILTPLSEITDEDAVEVAKIVAPNIDDPHHLKNIGNNAITDISNGHTIVEVGSIAFIAIIDYLRSKNYDLGYMHIPSLITAGLAIKKTI